MEALIATFPSDTVVIHGDQRGADSLAGACARLAGLEVVAFPPDWEMYGRGGGVVRNQQMLDEGKPDRVYAFPGKPLEETVGTRDMVTRSRAAGLPVEVFE